MAHFQVPDDRTFDTAESPLQPWPENADGYRLFVKGNGPDERIGIHLGQAIELQLTGGRGLRIETIESQSARRTAAVSGLDQSVLEARLGGPVRLSTATATSDKQKFTVSTGERRQHLHPCDATPPRSRPSSRWSSGTSSSIRG